MKNNKPALPKPSNATQLAFFSSLTPPYVDKRSLTGPVTLLIHFVNLGFVVLVFFCCYYFCFVFLDDFWVFGGSVLRKVEEGEEIKVGERERKGGIPNRGRNS